MHIGILATNQPREDKRLIEAAEKAGHEITIIDLLKCSISSSPEEAYLYYKGERTEGVFDIIIPRINVEDTDYGLTILRQFQAKNVYTTDTAYSIELGRDKLRCLQYLMRHQIPFPRTGYCYSTEQYQRIIETVGGTPVVIKVNEGTEGAGTFLAEDEKQAVNLLKTFSGLNATIIIQQFIAEFAGTDLRAFVVGDKIVASMQRISQDQDFRANISLGGRSEPVELTDEERAIALRSAKAIGLNIAGVDIIRSDKGPQVIEINVSPDFSGTYGLEETTGVDVAAAIIDYAVKGKEAHDRGEGVWLQDAVTQNMIL